MKRPVKWQFENSWGANSGENGYLTFTDQWFNEYMFRIVVNKKFISQKVLGYLQTKIRDITSLGSNVLNISIKEIKRLSDTHFG